MIYALPNPRPPHAIAISLVDVWTRTVFSSGYYIRIQMPLDIRSDTEPNPDVAVVVGSIRDYTAADPTIAVLVVEVSDSTLFTDVTTKAEKYATAGV